MLTAVVIVVPIAISIVAGMFWSFSETELKFIEPIANAPKVVFQRHESIRQLALKKARDDDDAEVDMTIVWVDLNKDGRDDICASFVCPTLYGEFAGAISCYIAQGKRSYKEVVFVKGVAPEYILLPGGKTKGYLDIQFGGPIVDTPRVWRWRGNKYR